MKRPLLSIHVSVFNLEKYIRQCLDSILEQTFTDYELLLIDNGSTDGSIVICEEYAQKYKQIKYIKFPLPTIIGRPITYALQHYAGKYFMSVDGDDYLQKGALQDIADAIQKSHADLIMGSFVCDVEEGMINFKDADFDEKKINDVPYEKALEYITTLPNFHTFQWRFIVKRKNVVNINKVKKDQIYSRYNDGITVTAYLVEAKSIYYVEKPFYVYRRRENSLSTQVEYGKQALDFFKTFVAISNTFQKEIRKTSSFKKNYIMHMMEAKFQLFHHLYLDMDETDYLQLVNVIKNYEYALEKIEYVSEDYREFYHYLQENDEIETALALYRRKMETNLNEKVSRCIGKNVYVFPTGVCGESLCSYLMNKGIRVVAFLDNDIKKNRKEFLNIECRLPQSLKEEPNKMECCVFIATAYRKNITKMRQQLIEYGILEKNILLR